MTCAGLFVSGVLALNPGPFAEPAAAAGNIYLTEEEITEIERGTACKSLVWQFFDLQKRMGSESLSTDFYDLKILPTDELIADRKGKYYVVYLKDATKRARFSFPGGRYIVPEFETRFRRSLSAFVREILATVEGGADYDVYVRGSSSATPMSVKRTLVEGAKYSTITYLPKTSTDKYGLGRPQIHKVPDAYANENLPFLRAAFLQDTVAKFYPLKKPTILQSDVAKSTEADAQFAELILFIDW